MLKMEINIYKYKTELHAHTSPVSSCADISPEELVQIYADAGYDAVCVTNHFTSRLMEMGARQAAEFFLSDYHRAAEEGERLKMSVILGMELRFVENSNDYLLYGFGEDEVEGIYSYMSGTPEDFYRDWKREGLLLIQAHPFRKGIVAKPPSVLDGIEVLNMARDITLARHIHRYTESVRYRNGRILYSPQALTVTTEVTRRLSLC